MYLPPDDADPPELPILCAMLMRANDGSGDGMSDEAQAPLRAHLRAKLMGWTPGPDWRARYDNGVREMALGVAEYIKLDVGTVDQRARVVKAAHPVDLRDFHPPQWHADGCYDCHHCGSRRHWSNKDHPRHHNNDCPYGIALRAAMDKGEAP